MDILTEVKVLNVADQVDELIERVAETLVSSNSKRYYRGGLKRFFTWWEQEGQPAITKSLALQYRAYLISQGRSPAGINHGLGFVRKLAEVAGELEILDPVTVLQIRSVRGVPQRGVRKGRWLTREQAQALINAPDIATRHGCRARAVLAVLVGAGLRRMELCRLTVEHLQMLEGRWAIVDLLGKGNRLRTIPIPAWVKEAVDGWTGPEGITAGPIFLALRRGRNTGGTVRDWNFCDIVHEYALPLGFDVAPHDLRRTYAKLARKGGAELEQIQLSLGHESILTTQRYLGTDQDFEDAPGDRLGLSLGVDPGPDVE